MDISKWFKGLRLKLVILAVVPLMGFCAVFYFGNQGILKTGEVAKKALSVDIQTVDNIGQLVASSHAIGRWTWIAYGIDRGESRQKFLSRAKNEIIGIDNKISTLKKLDLDQDSQKKLIDVEKNWTETKLAMEDITNFLSKLKEDDDLKAKIILTNRFVKNLVPMTDTLKLIKTNLDKTQQTSVVKAESYIKETLLTMKVVSLFFASIIFGISILIALKMSSGLSEVASKLKGLSEKVRSASDGVTDSSNSLSQAGTEQSSSLQETAASVHELSMIVEKNANDASVVADSFLKTKGVANEGKAALLLLQAKMNDIEESNFQLSEKSQYSFKKIKETVSLITEIQNKTKIINDIVFQTKLLSFNASVEAARANEHGKGFAVVAEEVGKLATMSGEAAKSITELLETSKEIVTNSTSESIELISQVINESKDNISKGVQHTQDCAKVFEAIFHDIELVSNMTESIARGSNEQAIGIKEINKALMQLEQVTQTNAHTAESTSSISKDLNHQVIELEDSVIQLNKMVIG